MVCVSTKDVCVLIAMFIRNIEEMWKNVIFWQNKSSESIVIP